jgi:hypothetical protein
MLREPSSRARDPGMESPFPQEVCDVSDPHDASSSLLLRLFAPVPSLERPPTPRSPASVRRLRHARQVHLVVIRADDDAESPITPSIAVLHALRPRAARSSARMAASTRSGWGTPLCS